MVLYCWALRHKGFQGAYLFWSIGLCDPVHPGLLIKKPFVECSHKEIKQEVWYQITQSEFNQYLHLDLVQITDYNVCILMFIMEKN